MQSRTIWLFAAICVARAGADSEIPVKDAEMRQLLGTAGDSGSSDFNSGSLNPFKTSHLSDSSMEPNSTSLPTFGLFFSGGEYAVYAIACLFTALYAFFYKAHVVDLIYREHGALDFSKIAQYQHEDVDDDFPVGLLECINEPCMCWRVLCFCTMAVRMAHTTDVVRSAKGRGSIGTYWFTLLAYLFGGCCCCIVPLCLTVYFRMMLKEAMGLQDHCLNDFCLAWLCQPCTIGQMALTVDREIGYEVEWCCDLVWDEKEAFEDYHDTPHRSNYNQSSYN